MGLRVCASSSRLCFFFAFLLLLRGKFVIRVLVFAGDNGKRCREVAGLFTDQVIRKAY